MIIKFKDEYDDGRMTFHGHAHMPELHFQYSGGADEGGVEFEEFEVTRLCDGRSEYALFDNKKLGATIGKDLLKEITDCIMSEFWESKSCRDDLEAEDTYEQHMAWRQR